MALTLVFVFYGIRSFSIARFTDDKTPLILPELREGDIVLRLGNGFYSDWFRLYASHEQKYSHIGLVTIENGESFVLHSEANDFTGIGGIKKEKLADFLKGITDYAFYRPDFNPEERNQVMAKAREYYQRNISFDLQFDNATDDQLYCTEYVAKSINVALDTALISPSLVFNKKRLFSLDDIYQNQSFFLLEAYGVGGGAN